MSNFGVITVDPASVSLDGTLKVLLQPGYNPPVGSTSSSSCSHLAT